MMRAPLVDLGLARRPEIDALLGERWNALRRSP